VGIHTELCYWLGMHSHAGAYKRDKIPVPLWRFDSSMIKRIVYIWSGLEQGKAEFEITHQEYR